MCNNFKRDQFFIEIFLKRASNSLLARYLTGTFGLYVIKALTSYMTGNSIDFVIAFCKSLLNTIMTPGYQKIGDDEILNGRSGFLMGIFLLRLLLLSIESL